MERRKFLAGSLAVPAVAAGAAQTGTAAGGREHYVLRRYHLRSGPQRKTIDGYLSEALVPAANRLGIRPVGVFSVDVGSESPSVYVLLPSASPATLADLEFHLEKDAEYLKAGAEFLNAPALQPAYVRVESSLMAAFEGHPKITPPPGAAERRTRLFELRTYESPTDQDHRRKVEMFHHGEFDIFQRAGFWQIFYGDVLVGPSLPKLTYMLGFPGMNERDKFWTAFRTDPEWKKLSASPRYAFEPIVSNIVNEILTPTPYSQI